MSPKKRVQCFIDGFNLYHAIHDLKDHSLKWLNLRSLSEAFIQGSQEELTEVFYFSAFATWIQDASKRHETYVQALEAVGVTSVIGHFKEKSKKCKNCNVSWRAHEEKESDVSLALYLLQQAYEDNYDKALIITADSDLSPAIKIVKSQFSDKEITVLTPPGRYDMTRELRSFVESRKIKKRHIANNLFEPIVVSDNGKQILIPEKYIKK